ncbi:MAG: C39 family peptidase [Candidatus Aenigmatarchaeota archaeon]|nr:C39 family peptidase [Candidatus Aenigmarchaeota archaeon]
MISRIIRALLALSMLIQLTISSVSIENMSKAEISEKIENAASYFLYKISEPFQPEITVDQFYGNIKHSNENVFLISNYYQNISNYLDLERWFGWASGISLYDEFKGHVDREDKLNLLKFQSQLKKDVDENVFWRDEQHVENWKNWPNSCGINALWIQLTIMLDREGKKISFEEVANAARKTIKGYWDPYCGNEREKFERRGIPYQPLKNPDGSIFRNPACLSSSVIPEIIQSLNIGYKGIALENAKLEDILAFIDKDIPVLALVRTNFLDRIVRYPNGAEGFGHFVVVVGYEKVNEKIFLYVSDPYPSEHTWYLNGFDPQTATNIRFLYSGVRRIDAETFLKSLYSNVDKKHDPISKDGYNGWIFYLEKYE